MMVYLAPLFDPMALLLAPPAALFTKNEITRARRASFFSLEINELTYKLMIT